jgi:hypothetical protein
LTIVEALRSDAVVNGFRIAVFPYEAATWIIWNEQMSGFYLTHHFGDWQFYPVTPPAITAVVTVSSNPYEFNRVLNYNTHTGAFYPWTLSTDPVNGVTSPRVHAVDYIQGPGGTNDPPAIFKYFTSVLNSDGTYSYTFSEESDPSYVDWDYATETTGDVYNSYFTTGYSLFGQGLRQFQPVYVEMFSRLNEPNMKYSIQGLWNFATNGNSGKWSTRQVTSLDKPNYGMAYRRHKIRGIGYALQLKISSVGNSPFDIMGWSMQITQNAGV